jgi:LEM-3-like GIY-YIG domain
MKPFYVYVLIDPFVEEVFYVGKGKNRRIEQHTKYIHSGNADDKLKIKRINKIIARGGKVIDRVIGRYDTEQEAFAVESTLIKWVYGLENLTNVVHGHYHKDIRDKGNLKIIKGLDIEQKLFPNDTVFTRELETENERYSISDKLNFVRNQLIIFNSKWQISEPSFRKKKDPSIYVNINNVSSLQLMMRSSGTDIVIMNIRAIKMGKEFNERFIQRYDHKFNIKMRNSNDSYFKLEGWINFRPHYRNDIIYILKNLIRAFDELN